MSRGRKLILWAVAFLAVFAIGYLPQYLESRRLRQELAAAHQETRLARLRDLAGMAYLEVTQNNYGVAASLSTEFFDQAQQLSRSISSGAQRQALEELLRRRDEVTAGIAKADPAVSAILQDIVRKLHGAPLGPAGS
jgi:hypothetical protein